VATGPCDLFGTMECVEKRYAMETTTGWTYKTVESSMLSTTKILRPTLSALLRTGSLRIRPEMHTKDPGSVDGWNTGISVPQTEQSAVDLFFTNQQVAQNRKRSVS
jgi:hypothetical protein